MSRCQQLVGHHHLLQLLVGAQRISGQMATSKVISATINCRSKMWTRFRPLFKKVFATSSDDKQIIHRLANISWKTSKNARYYFSRLSELIEVITDSYASYQIELNRPAEQPQGGFSNDALTKLNSDHVLNFAEYIFLQLFWARLTKNIR
jgi:hypothetical protein